jgi:outer membrane lipoprotein-sorting protein
MRRLSLSVLGVFLFVGLSYPVRGQEPSAEKIRAQMASAYATCHSYVDEGEVRTVFLEQDRRRTQVKPFSTAFVRPSDFRFEYKSRRGEDEWDTYVIWRGAEAVKTWWSVRPGTESRGDLFSELGRAAGVSSLASVTVPALLMPDQARGNWIKSLSALKVVGEEEVHGSKAYRVEGLNSHNDAVTIWVDQGTMLLLKIYEKKRFEKYEAETTTTYKPRVNVEVAQEKLAFNPPEKGN